MNTPHPVADVANPRSFPMLCLDGGGIRGVYTAHILARMEAVYDVNWTRDFRLIAGTSTGSIIAAGLVCGLKASELVQLYAEHGDRLFPRTYLPLKYLIASRFPNRNLRALLAEKFGDKKLGEIEFPLVIPSTDIGNGCVHVLKSGYDPGFHRDRDVLVRDAILASTAAPTYFNPAIVGKYVLADGGLWANNPSLVAVVEAQKRLGQNLAGLRVFSIGTGSSRSFYPHLLPWWKRWQGWGFGTRWGGNKFISMILNLQAESATNSTKLLLEPGQVLRINFESDAELPLDDPSSTQDLISRADRDFAHRSRDIEAFMQLKRRVG